MKLLLIEDEPKIVKLYTQILDNLDVAVTVAQSAEQALDHLKKSQFKLIIVDLMLPGMSGNDFIDNVKTLELHEKTNIIVLTNMGSGFNKEELIERGVKQVLLKLEVGPEELRNLIQRYC